LLGAHDKLRTAALLAVASVPQPRTVYVAHCDGEAPLEPPVVVKPRFGSWGADVFRCETADELTQVLKDVSGRGWFRKHGALIQELLPPVGHDLRIVVAGRRVVGAMERVAKPGEWRTNVSLGGTRRPILPSALASALAVRAAAATRLNLVGVDLFPVAGGHVVLDLNGAVEFDQGYDLGSSDVYESAASALRLSRTPDVNRAAVA
jgi:RimK family alpha-L-glutamate ligase